MVQGIHELDLLEHVASVRAVLVLLQDHHAARRLVHDLRTEQEKKKSVLNTNTREQWGEGNIVVDKYNTCTLHVLDLILTIATKKFSNSLSKFSA